MFSLTQTHTRVHTLTHHPYCLFIHTRLSRDANISSSNAETVTGLRIVQNQVHHCEAQTFTDTHLICSSWAPKHDLLTVTIFCQKMYTIYSEFENLEQNIALPQQTRMTNEVQVFFLKYPKKNKIKSPLYKLIKQLIKIITDKKNIYCVLCRIYIKVLIYKMPIILFYSIFKVYIYIYIPKWDKSVFF